MLMARLLTVAEAVTERAPDRPATFDDAVLVSAPVPSMPVTKALAAVCVTL